MLWRLARLLLASAVRLRGGLAATFLFCAGPAAAMLLCAGPAAAAWAPGGNPVTTATGSQFATSAVPDGAGGVIVSFGGAYAQRLTKNGDVAPGWPADGRLLSAAPGTRFQPLAAPDGAGGAFVTFGDTRNDVQDLYAQHVLASGALDPLWPANGAPVAVAALNQYTHSVASDRMGGFLVAWQDDRTGALDIYIQRLDATGAALWTANGILVCGATGSQYLVKVIGDGSGGAYLAWMDERGGDPRVFAQHLAADGSRVPGWPDSGLEISTEFGDQRDPVLALDGAGGVLIAWSGSRNHINYHPWVQRLTSGGGLAPGWTAAGVKLADVLQTQTIPRIVADGTGGAIVVWHDFRDIQNPIYNPDIYARRVSASGVAQWAANGVPVCAASGRQETMVATTDDQGGVIVCWTDYRGTSADIYAVRLLSNGSPALGWTVDGTPLCAVQSDQHDPAIVPDGLSGAIVAWSDSRNGTPSNQSDVYAAKTLDDVVVPVLAALVSAEALPGLVRLMWRVPEAGLTARLYRRLVGGSWVEIGAASSAGDGSLVFEDRSAEPGASYEYRIGVDSETGEMFSAEVRVDVPVGPVFALEGARPNPATVDLAVRFSLPDDAPATLEVLDVSGRSWFRRNVGALGPGRHLVRATAGGALPPGLYLIRLTRAGDTLNARASVVR